MRVKVGCGWEMRALANPEPSGKIAPKAVVSVVAVVGGIDPKPRFSGRQHRPPVIHKREPKERYTIAMSAISNRRGALARRIAGRQTAPEDVSGRRGGLVAELISSPSVK